MGLLSRLRMAYLVPGSRRCLQTEGAGRLLGCPAQESQWSCPEMYPGLPFGLQGLAFLLERQQGKMTMGNKTEASSPICYCTQGNFGLLPSSHAQFSTYCPLFPQTQGSKPSPPPSALDGHPSYKLITVSLDL